MRDGTWKKGIWEEWLTQWFLTCQSSSFHPPFLVEHVVPLVVFDLYKPFPTGPGWELTPCLCSTGDAEIGSSNVSSLKSEEFHVFLDELNEEEIWGSSHTLKSCGKAISIETASLSEYTRFVLRSASRYHPKTVPLSSFGEKVLLYLTSVMYILGQNECWSMSVFVFRLSFLIWTIWSSKLFGLQNASVSY